MYKRQPSPSASPDKTTESLKDAKTNIAAQLDDYYAALESSIPDDKKSAAQEEIKKAKIVIENMKTAEQVTAYPVSYTHRLVLRSVIYPVKMIRKLIG